MRRLLKDTISRKLIRNAAMEDGESQAMSNADDTVTVTRSSLAGFYKFFVDMQYGLGIHMPFLLTKAEANVLRTAKKLCQTSNILATQAKCIAQ